MGNKVSSSHSATTSFHYTPLQENCIRLVTLQPRRKKGRHNKIECTLTHVAFREKPIYDALSYAWGAQMAKITILLNGIEFEVGENLAGALINIRGLESAGEGPRKLWIDAICINQADVMERNRQVRHMPVIYERARKVLVWLGTRYSFNYHCSDEGNRGMDIPKHNDTNGVHYRPMLTHDIVHLCGREYWKRLWIIQEIGKATFLRVHYDSKSVGWVRFITNVNSVRELAGSVPLKLVAQLRGHYQDGVALSKLPGINQSSLRGIYGDKLTLSNLLRANQNALCKDPRDKVYGLLGLAIDVDNTFPLDYDKSLFEVFMDTVFHQNRDKGRSQFDILDISRLLVRMLGVRKGLEPDGPTEIFDAGDVGLDSIRTGIGRLRVPGRLVGRIKYIGPTCEDLLGRIDQLSEWRASIMRSIQDFNLRSKVLRQDVLFVKDLESFDENSQRTVFNFDREIKWKDFQQYSIETVNLNFSSNSEAGTFQTTESVLSNCRIFLLHPPVSEHAVSWMGLAPRGTRAGDFVCQFAGIERAVIVRQSLDTDPAAVPTRYSYEIIGCAGLARGMDTLTQIGEGSLSPNGIFDVGRLSAPSKSDHIDLYMGINTAYQISR